MISWIGRKATQPSESPVMSLECISKMSRQMFRQNNMQHPVRALRVDISFVQFIITTAQNCLKMVSWIIGKRGIPMPLISKMVGYHARTHA